MFRRLGLLFLIVLICALASTGVLADTQWNVEVVDGGGNVGQYSSLVLDAAGRPHISYSDATNEDLKYARRTDSGWSVEVVDSPGYVGGHTSIALGPDGLPRISYEDRLNHALKYAVKSDAGWSTTVVDAIGYVGLYTSLALDATGRAHISYYDYTWSRNALKYASETPAGWSIESVDSGGELGLYTSLALDEAGNPHISYYDKTNAALKYTHQEGGTWVTETVDSGTVGEQQTSIVLQPGGEPCISYYDSVLEDSKVACRTSAGWNIETVDSAGTVGLYSSLAVDPSGGLHVAYYDNSNADLKFASRSSTGSWSAQVVDASGRVGGYASLAVDTDSNFHVSYYDFSNAALKFATSMPVPVVEPDIAVSPAQLDFGATVVGQPHTLGVVVTNVGSGSLLLQSAVVNGPGYELGEPVPETALEPGASLTLTIVFDPTTAGVSEGLLTVVSDDPDDSSLSVPLRGEGLLPAAIDVKPDTLNVSRDSTRLFTTYIELPEDIDVSAVDVSTVRLSVEGFDTPYAADLAPVALGDYDADGVMDLMVKFPTLDGVPFVAGDLVVDITGRLFDGTGFSGSDTVRVIDNGTLSVTSKKARRR